MNKRLGCVSYTKIIILLITFEGIKLSLKNVPDPGMLAHVEVMGISYTRKMCPQEKSSGGWVTSQEVLPARGEAASEKPAWRCCWFCAVAAVLALPHLSCAQ